MKFCPECREALEPRTFDGIERLACPSARCGFVHWRNPTPVVAALVRVGEQYVLARNAQWRDGVFSLVTGFLEQGEVPEDAILREVWEELGVRGEHVAFLGHHMLAAHNQLIIAFAVRAAGSVAPGAEIAEVKLVSASELAAFDFGRFELSARIVAQALLYGTSPS